MRTPLVTALAALSAAVALSVHPAQAQTPTDTAAPPIAAVRGGAYFPFNSRIKNTVGKTWYGGGLDYTYGQKAGLSRSILSLDYIERSGGGGTVRLIPVTIGQFTVQGGSNSQGSSVKPYFGVGVGAYFVHQTIPNDVGIIETNNVTTIGGYVAAGLDLPSNLLLEARYHILPKVGSANSSGLQLMGGFRF